LITACTALMASSLMAQTATQVAQIPLASSLADPGSKDAC